MNDGDLILNLIKSFKLPSNSVHILGQCMGAAMSIRAFRKSSDLFTGTFIFINATIGTWPSKFESNFGRILAWHELDDDHMREAACYKNLKRLSELGRVEFIDNIEYQETGRNDEVLNTEEVQVEGISRCDTVSFKNPTRRIIDKVLSFLAKPISKPSLVKNVPKITNVTSIQNSKVEQSSRVKIFIKLRPSDSESFIDSITSDTIRVKNLDYKFNGIITNQNAQRMYETEVSEFLKGDLSKIIFAYGQTGSGKSYTIVELITTVSSAISSNSISIKYVQIYNEKLHDMLSLNLESATSLSLPTISDLILVVSKMYEEYRTTKSTNMNDTSSRSHALLYVTLPEKTLCVVDLAGNERIIRSHVFSTKLKVSPPPSVVHY